jgi:DNA-binding SARP family transcriptional activator
MALERKSNLPFLAQLLPRQGRKVGNMVYRFIHHPDPELRIFSMKTLTQMEFRDAEKDIANLTRDDHPEVQIVAVESLERIKSFTPLPLDVHVFGRFRLFRDKREIPAKAWRLKTAKLLFKYLLLHPNQEISSEKLVDVFYQDADPEDAKQRLHKAASALRAALEPGISAKRESGYLKASAGYYQLVLPDHSTVDAFEFGRTCHQAENAEYQGKTRLSQSLYKSALNLYQSDLLEEDAYEDWIDPFRTRYSNLYLKALMKTAQLHFQLFEYDQSIEPLQRLLAKDAWHEDAWLLLMKCHLALGNKSKAMQAFKQCATLLRNELDIGPSKALTDLFRSIK